MVGMKNTGKTTLIRKLIKGNYHDTTSNNINAFNNTVPPTANIEQLTEVLFINGKFYECTFIDTPGLTEKFISASDISNELDKVNLILFVFKHGDISGTTEVPSLLSDHCQDMRCLSASVITCCDELTNESYENIIREFTSDPITKQFCADHNIGERVYPIGSLNNHNVSEKVYSIGFSKRTDMQAIAIELNANFIQENISKLLQLIELSSDHTAAADDKNAKKCSVM